MAPQKPISPRHGIHTVTSTSRHRDHRNTYTAKSFPQLKTIPQLLLRQRLRYRTCVKVLPCPRAEWEPMINICTTKKQWLLHLWHNLSVYTGIEFGFLFSIWVNVMKRYGLAFVARCLARPAPHLNPSWITCGIIWCLDPENNLTHNYAMNSKSHSRVHLLPASDYKSEGRSGIEARGC
jgi:hypothetical protein